MAMHPEELVITDKAIKKKRKINQRVSQDSSHMVFKTYNKL